MKKLIFIYVKKLNEFEGFCRQKWIFAKNPAVRNAVKRDFGIIYFKTRC